MRIAKELDRDGGTICVRCESLQELCLDALDSPQQRLVAVVGAEDEAQADFMAGERLQTRSHRQVRILRVQSADGHTSGEVLQHFLD